MKHLKPYLVGIALIGGIFTNSAALAYDDEFDAVPSMADRHTEQEKANLDVLSPYCEDYRLILSEYDPSIEVVPYAGEPSMDDWMASLGEDYSQILNNGSL